MNDGKNHKKDPQGAGERFWAGDGVGCESCHGPAEHYLSEHYRVKFRQLSGSEKESRYGLFDLKNLETRAQTCAECHVGGSDRDVNHDLIAAGHPRLIFEFAGFQAIYPKHWKREADRQRYPDFEARSWAVGQVASAQAALKLLEARAAGDKTKPWPEFAEYSCFACHKDLTSNLPRPKSADAAGKAGTFPWGTWNLSVLEAYAKQPGVDGEAFLASLKQLRGLMQTPGSRREQVQREAGNLEVALAAWRKALQSQPAWDPKHLQELMEGLAKEGERRADTMDWDQAAQLYLALSAVYVGRKELAGAAPPGPVEQDLRRLRDRLRASFKKGYDSPRDFDPLADPPLKTQLQQFRSHLEIP
jgi:hypothetical protein